jgi:hypothetical protein
MKHTTLLPLKKLKANPSNPRTIRKEKLEKLVNSLRQFPQMLDLRPLVVESLDNPVVLGGNMRLKALQALGFEHVPVLTAEELTAEQRAEFVIKDNIGYGDWDWDTLANEWDAVELQEWGLDLPDLKPLDPDQLGDNFELDSEDREPFTNLTFHLADEQAQLLQNTLADLKKTDGFKYMDTFGNENSNGNALHLLVTSWLALRK